MNGGLFRFSLEPNSPLLLFHKPCRKIVEAFCIQALGSRQPAFTGGKYAVTSVVHPVFAVRIGVDTDGNASAGGFWDQRPVEIEAVGVCIELDDDLVTGAGVEYGLPVERVAFAAEQEPAGRVRFLTSEEVAALLEAVDGRVDRKGHPKHDFQLFVRIALFTGARRGEVAGLEWRDIDLRHNRVTFRDTKGGGDRTVPLPATLAEAVKAFGKVRPIDPKARLFKHNFRFDWREVQGTIPNFRFHDTRHNVASQLAMSGASLLDIATVTGHKTLAMVKRYSHLSDDHVRERLEQAAAKIAPKKS